MHLTVTVLVEEGEEWDGEERRDCKVCAGIKLLNALLESLALRLFYTLSVRWPAETRTRLFAQPAKMRALPTTNQNDNDYSRTRFIITILTQNILFFIQAFQRNVTHANHLYLGKTVWRIANFSSVKSFFLKRVRRIWFVSRWFVQSCEPGINRLLIMLNSAPPRYGCIV